MMKISVLDRDAIGKDVDISGFARFGEVEIHDRTVPENAVEHIGNECLVVVSG